MLGILKAYILY